LIFLASPHLILAQDQMVKRAETAVKITEARKANAKLMHQYSWQSRTELMENGEVKDMHSGAEFRLRSEHAACDADCGAKESFGRGIVLASDHGT